MQLTLLNEETEKMNVSLFGKTCQEYLAARITPSVASLLHSQAGAVRHEVQGEEDGQMLVMCLDPKGQSRGESSMPNISDWPNDASVCLLSQVLERGSVPQKYYLSSTACAGILRRAEKRGKKLPEMLEKALKTQAAMGS